VNTIQYQKEFPVCYQADLLVAGGGPAGIAAAVTAARAGLKVILAEQTGTPGGCGTLAMVPELMNFDDGEHFLAGGFGREVHDALFPPCTYTREWRIADPEKLKRLYDSLLLSAGVLLLYYTRAVDAVTENGKIQYAVMAGPEGLYIIEAGAYLDATGSGSLATAAGAESEFGDENGNAMPSTLCSLWGGVDFEKKGIDGKQLEKAIQDGVFSQFDTMLPGIKPSFAEVGVGGGNVGHVFKADDRSTESMTDAMVTGRKGLAEYENYYRKYVPGCENTRLLHSADFLGVRESRRIKCLFTLTYEDFDRKEPFTDEIGRYSYPIDIHPMTPDRGGMAQFTKDVNKRHEKGGSYSIPFGSLLPNGFRNLLVAGKIIGTDHAMEASVRVIPGCYITGQAAGMAAAVAKETGCDIPDICVSELQARLRKIGAYLTI